MRLRPLLRRLKSDITSRGPAALVALGIVAGAAGAAHAAVAWVWPAVVEHPYFKIRSIRVKCDTDSTPPEVIAARAGLFDGTSVWDVDVERAELILGKATWVREARVTRRFPDRVTLEVRLREAVAATLTPDGPYLVDREGVVFREEGESGHPDLPYVTGWDRARSRGERIARLRRALEIVVAAEKAGIELSELNIDAAGEAWIYPEMPRIAVRIGRRFDAETAALRLRAVLERLPERSVAQLYAIDLGYPDRVVLRTEKDKVGGLSSLLARTQRPARPRAVTVSAGAGKSGDRG